MSKSHHPFDTGTWFKGISSPGTRVIGMRLYWSDADGTSHVQDIFPNPSVGGMKGGEFTIRWNAKGIFEIVS